MATVALVGAFVALVLNGLMAGVFFAFSVAVMRGLDVAPAEHAVTAMQGINREILNPVFLLAFTLAPVFAGVAGVLILIAGDGTAGGLLLAAAVVYLVGVIGVTRGLNIPLNNAIDAAKPSGPDQAAEVWAAHSPPWTRWNHVRTVANTASLLLTGLAIYVCGS